MDSKTNSFPLESAVAELRKNKILPEDNRTDLRKSIFESDTGEILLKRREKELILRTSRTEGIAAPAGTSKKLSILHIGKLPCNATVAISSLDGKSLEKSAISLKSDIPANVLSVLLINLKISG